jgi:hypothetical protein
MKRSKSGGGSGRARSRASGSPGARRTRKAGAKPGSDPKAGAARGSAARLIDQRIRELADWRGETLARMRALILAADAEILEEWKWNVPVWSLHGILCTGETYSQVVKLTFSRGASLADPARLFNSSLEGTTRRAIDIRAGELLDACAFQELVKAAVAANARAAGVE